MSNAAYIHAEDEARVNMLRQWGIARAKGDAQVIPIGDPARKPLGLAPVGDEGDDEPEPPARQDNRPAWLSDVDHLVRHSRNSANKILSEEIGKFVAQVVNDLRREFETKLAGSAQQEIAELKNTIGAMQNETTALKLILGRFENPRKGRARRKR